MKRRHKAGIWRNSGCSLNILTDDEAHEIHLSTLELLKDTGVFVENDDALETYEPPPLSENVRSNIRSIIEEAEKELGVYQTSEK